MDALLSSLPDDPKYWDSVEGAADLMVAAHARHYRRTLVTRDAAARFDELTGVRARVV